MESVKSYKENRLNGKLIIWHENGQMKLEEHYKAGNSYGKWTKWKNNGLKQSELNYKPRQILPFNLESIREMT